MPSGRSAVALARCVALALATAASMYAAPVLADETPATVDELKKRAVQEMSDLHYREAVALCKQAIAIAPGDAVLHYNLGRAHEALGEYPEALDAVEEFARRARPELRAKVPQLEALIADLRSRVGALTLSCSIDVPDGRVMIGDRTVAERCTAAPLALRLPIKPPTQSFDVRLVSPTYDASVVRVDLTGGAAPVSVLLDAVSRSTSGTLRIVVRPPTATVSVDGVARGNSPLEVPIKAGAHVIDVKAGGYEPVRVPVLVTAGAGRDVDLALTRKAPLTTKWWFWTAVGVGVVAIAGATYVLVVQPERDPSSGDLPPGQVSAGLVRF